MTTTYSIVTSSSVTSSCQQQRSVIVRLLQLYVTRTEVIATRCRPNGRNTTGPPCSVNRPTARWPARLPAVLQTTTHADRPQRAKQYWPIGGLVKIVWTEAIAPIARTAVLASLVIIYIGVVFCEP